MKIIKSFLLALSVLALFACSAEQTGPRTHGVYMLLDTSGTYTKELKQAQRVISFSLLKLKPGDSFAVARVDTGSFSEKDIVAKVTFEDRPSRMNQQKRVFLEKIDKFVKSVKGSAYTDITGGILQAIEFLNERNPGKKTILIFSDLKEELRKGYKRDIDFQLQGYRVIALNVTKLRSDNIDPKEYLDRLENWRLRVESGGGEWKVINDLERLEALFN
ncbi:hypothetical protein MNBD_GAMMA23-27 [hydrothermal vent metagenome]|uniref:VWFA domain-containing protein n=1 Tax=hydrothermal vent metagenome TaxID=652676 RepID=A0A3B1AFG1_9ZZZZ